MKDEDNRNRLGIRAPLMLAFAITAVTCVGFSLIAQWLGSCKGSSREVSTVRPKLEKMIRSYRKETGRWPSSMADLEGRFSGEMDYEYVMTCQNHPWNHRMTGTLTTYTLIRHPKGDVEGGIAYQFKRQRMLTYLELWVEDPNTTVKTQ
ncbi:MAG: hypothetical protein HONBIEJF_01513 [Fimbriimonadaceae bacterium]|nr:hypothetical protein [Fimbriimonadaceae bacterium]